MRFEPDLPCATAKVFVREKRTPMPESGSVINRIVDRDLATPLIRPITPSPDTTGIPIATPSLVPRLIAMVSSKLPGDAAITSAATLGIPGAKVSPWLARNRRFSLVAALPAARPPRAIPNSRLRRLFSRSMRPAEVVPLHHSETGLVKSSTAF
ncbi:unannotated protein [freshwater metagenome]|uniref:Unannotated protein n=1 Tax=freshwater metagenome TaxID=449393 RepID=A0A6J7QGG3_9ZZZZ